MAQLSAKNTCVASAKSSVTTNPNPGHDKARKDCVTKNATTKTVLDAEQRVCVTEGVPTCISAETEFVRELTEDGTFCLEIIITGIFTFWYMSIIIINLYCLLVDFVCIVRCEVPELEKYFNFEQVLNISVKDTKSRHKNLQYCTYDLRNYTELLEKNNYDYNAIMNEIRKETADPKQVLCQTYVTVNRAPILGSYGMWSLHGIREEFQLFCSQSYWYSGMQEARRFAIFVSSAIVGLLADINGRKITFAVTALLQAIGYAIILLPSKWFLLVGAFCCGLAEPSDTVIYIAFLEKCNRWTRVYMGNLLLFIYPLANLIGFLLCNGICKWRYIHLANLSMFLVVPFGSWYFVESPRWLMFTGNKLAAWKALQEYALDIEPHISNPDQSKPSKPTIKKILRYFRLHIYRTRFKSIVVVYALCGLFMDIGARINKIYLSLTWISQLSHIALQTCVSMITYVFTVTIGRQRTIFAICMILAAVDVVLLLQNLECNDDLVVLILVSLHRTFAQALYCLLIFYTTELFPTPCRVTALGICSSVYWIGKVITSNALKPLTQESRILTYMPGLIATISCALTVVFLPNTHNEFLPDIPYDSLHDTI